MYLARGVNETRRNRLIGLLHISEFATSVQDNQSEQVRLLLSSIYSPDLTLMDGILPSYLTMHPAKIKSLPIHNFQEVFNISSNHSFVFLS